MRAALEVLEANPSDSVSLSLAWLAGQALEHDPDDLRGALRRAELLLAAGGDPRRDLELDGRAVTALAADLGAEDVRDRFEDALAALATDVEGLPSVAASLAELRAQPDLAWRCYAGALLAEAIADT